MNVYILNFRKCNLRQNKGRGRYRQSYFLPLPLLSKYHMLVVMCKQMGLVWLSQQRCCWYYGCPSPATACVQCPEPGYHGQGPGRLRPPSPWGKGAGGLRRNSSARGVIQRSPLWQVGWELPDTPSALRGQDKGKMEGICLRCSWKGGVPQPS